MSTSSGGISPNLQTNLQQLERVEQDLSQVRDGRVHKIFGKTFSGARSLEKREVSLGNAVLEQAKAQGDGDAAKKVAIIVGRAFHRLESKEDKAKHQKQSNALKQLLQEADQGILQSDKVEKISFNDLQAEDGEEISPEVFSQKAFSEPNYGIKIPYRDGLVDIKGLGTGQDDKVKGAGAYGRIYFGEFEGKKLAFKLQRIQEKTRTLVENEVAQSLKLHGMPHLIGAEHAITIGEEYVLTVMEAAEGGELFDRLSDSMKIRQPQRKEQFFSQKERIRLVKEVAIGVREMHKIGLTHLDIKPENVLLKNDGEGVLRAYVVDFGFTSYEGSRGKLQGTPGYYAPEKLSTQNAALGASDVFSLGMVLHLTITDGHSVVVGQNGAPSPSEYRDAISRSSYVINQSLFMNRLQDSLDTIDGLVSLVRSSIAYNSGNRVTIDEFIEQLQELENRCKYDGSG